MGSWRIWGTKILHNSLDKGEMDVFVSEKSCVMYQALGNSSTIGFSFHCSLQELYM